MEILKTKKQNNSKVDGKGIKVPHTLVIIAAIIMIVSIATYLIPGFKSTYTRDCRWSRNYSIFIYCRRSI